MPDRPNFVWKGFAYQDLEDDILKDMNWGADGYQAASDLIFHVYRCSADWDGPGVFVWGEENDPNLHAEYVHHIGNHTVTVDMKDPLLDNSEIKKLWTERFDDDPEDEP